MSPQTSANAEDHSRSCAPRKDRGGNQAGGTQSLDLNPSPGSFVPHPSADSVHLALVAPLLSLLPPLLLLSQGLQDECQYLLQPQLIVRRLLDVAVLVPGRPSEQTLSVHNRSALYK